MRAESLEASVVVHKQADSPKPADCSGSDETDATYTEASKPQQKQQKNFIFF